LALVDVLNGASDAQVDAVVLAGADEGLNILRESFMNDTRNASIALAAYLVISAERISIMRIGLFVRTKGA